MGVQVRTTAQRSRWLPKSCLVCAVPVDDLGAATVKLGKDNSPSALVTHLQYAHPEEYKQMWAMEQKFAADPRMVTLPFVCAEIEEDIWQLLQTALTEIIEEELGKAGQTGKEKSDVDGGMGQGGGGAGGGAGNSTVKTFGGGKKTKVGVFAVPGVQDASVMARKVNIYMKMCTPQS